MLTVLHENDEVVTAALQQIVEAWMRAHPEAASQPEGTSQPQLMMSTQAETSTQPEQMMSTQPETSQLEASTPPTEVHAGMF